MCGGGHANGESLQQPRAAGRRRVKCPARVDGMRLNPIWAGQIRPVDRNNWRVGHCAYESERPGARPTFARVMWAESENAKALGCTGKTAAGNRIGSPTHRVEATFGAAGPSGRRSAFALAEDLMHQAEARAIPCPAREPGSSETVPVQKFEKRPAGPKHPGILTKGCRINAAVFDRDWRKFSDFNERLAVEPRSHPAKKYLDAYENLFRRKVRAFKLQRDLALSRMARKEMRIYREALLGGARNDLLKGLLHLAAFTGMSVRDDIGLTKTYARLFTGAHLVDRVGDALDEVSTLALSDDAYTIDTLDIPGKVKRTGVETAIEAMRRFDRPGQMVAKLAQNIGKAILPNPQLGEGELGELREQHLKKRQLDDALQRSYRRDAARRGELRELKRGIHSGKYEIARWEIEERKRVRRVLTENCRREG